MTSPHIRKPSQAGLAPVIIIAIVLAVVAIGGGAAYVYLNPSGPSGSRMMEKEDTAKSKGGAGKMAADSAEALSSGSEVSRSFEQIFAANQNLECTWKPPATAGEEAMEGFVEGKLYTAGTRGRSMATLQINGIPSEVNAVYNETGITSWFEMAGQKFGFVMTNEEMAAQDDTLTQEERQQAEQYRDEMIVSCVPWTPDESMFVIPSDVNFDTPGIGAGFEATSGTGAETMIPDSGEGMPSQEEMQKLMREMESR